MRNQRIEFINNYNDRFGTEYNRHVATYVALGAAMELLSPHQWQIVEDTVRDFVPVVSRTNE
jgi:hypothetical protein